MKKHVMLGIAVMCFGLAAPVHAYHGGHGEHYFAADAFFWAYDPERAPAVSDLGIRLRAGRLYNEFLGVEGHLATGGNDVEGSSEGELDYLTGVYAKLILPVDRALHLYALLGASMLNGKFSPGDDEIYDLSGGFGAELGIAPNLAINADYMRYADTSNVIFDTISMGVVYHFN